MEKYNTINQLIGVVAMESARQMGTTEAAGILAEGMERVVVDGWRELEEMSFGDAIKALKAGARVARKGWNGQGMFLWLKPAARIKAEWCKDFVLKALVEANGGTIEAGGTICMFTAQKTILTGWVASQTDMLAEDWVVVE